MKRYSKQREVISTILSGTNRHPSATEVYDKARAELPNISLGTVYRNLMELEKDGAAYAFNIGETTHFDANTLPHPHFYCRVCGGVTDLCCDMNDFTDTVSGLDGYKVEQQTMIFTGKCRECIKKEKILEEI